MDQHEQSEHIARLADRYHVASQDIARWIERGYSISDVDWAYRFAETSPGSDVAKLFEIRSQGMSWDEIHRQIGNNPPPHYDPQQEAAGRKLVPGGERRTSRYWYRDEARMLDRQPLRDG